MFWRRLEGDLGFDQQNCELCSFQIRALAQEDKPHWALGAVITRSREVKCRLATKKMKEVKPPGGASTRMPPLRT